MCVQILLVNLVLTNPLSPYPRAVCVRHPRHDGSVDTPLSPYPHAVCVLGDGTVIDARGTSQPIPACGVRLSMYRACVLVATSQPIPACGVRRQRLEHLRVAYILSAHTRVRCASRNGEKDVPGACLSAHTRVRCASAKATKMSCVHGIHMHNFYLIECIRKR